MAAPIYTQAEADSLLQLEKWVEYEAWQERSHGRANSDSSVEIRAFPEPNDDRIRFVIEIWRHDISDAFAIVLKGRILPRPFEGLCRYDVQDNEHGNPPWFPPPVVEVGVPHRHLYNERAVRELHSWHACASPINLPPHGSPSQLRERLLGQFIAEMKIRFSESETQRNLFGHSL